MISFKEYCSLNEGRPALKSSHQKTVERLEYLSKQMNKYGHRWGENPSPRMESWVYEYNDIKSDNKPAWEEYCKKNGFTLGHDAYDCLA